MSASVQSSTTPYPSIFQRLDLPAVVPARAFCRHLRSRDGMFSIDAYEPDARGQFSSRKVWFGISEGVGMLVAQWLEVRGYALVNDGRALYA